MTTFDEAIALLERAVTPLASESLPLEAAAGRYLAEDLHARSDAPRHAVSAMDGYAVIEAATAPGQWLDVVGEARPGMPPAAQLSPGQAMRIFTGAALPHGADCVVMQEYARREGDRVLFREGNGPARHVRSAGSDFREGDRLLGMGTRLTPRAMVSAAAADRSAISVYRRPRVAIIATGDELAAPGTAFTTPGALAESASYGVAALCEAAGAELVLRLRGRDDLRALEPLAAQALAAADCVVVTGGASVGDHDLARPMFAKSGIEPVFGRIAIKPGKPVWLAHAPHGRMVMGLPGNPGSAMVTARLFLQPLLATMQGGSIAGELGFIPMPLAAPIRATGDRETFHRASAGPGGLTPVRNQESGAQAPLAAADWLIRRAADATACAAGDIVRALRF